MSRILSRLAVVAALALPLAAEARIGATHTLIKVQPTDEVETLPTIRIAAAANEVEAFQVIVEGGQTGLQGVTMTLSDLEGEVSLPATTATLYRAAYLPIRNRSDANARSGPTPDALIPDVDPFHGEKRNAFPFDVPPGENRTVWVDVHVPPATPAGIYRGQLEVVDGAKVLGILPVELEVFPFELPSTPTYRTAFGLSWNGTCRAHHGEVWCGGDEARYDGLRVLYGVAGLNNRVSFSGVAGAPVEGPNGNLDFGRYDRAYGPLLDGTADTLLPGARLTSIQVWQKDPGPADFAAWARHFRERGWFDRLFDYTCDEPPLTCAWGDIGPRQAAVHEGDPDFPSLVTTTVGHLRDRGLYESTDIIVPVVNFVEGKSGEYQGDQSPIYRQAAAEGKTIWIYSSCMSHGCGGTVGGEYEDPELAGWPSLVVDHTAVRNRAMPWVAWRFGFTGELYWDTVYAFASQGDPWTDQWDFSGNGDGTLLYPGTPAKIGGTTHVPVESIRLKQVRDGIEDYEYLHILAGYDAEAAQRFAAELFPHAWSAEEVTPDRLLATRRAIAEAIVAHVQPDEEESPGVPSEGGGPVEPGAPVEGSGGSDAGSQVRGPSKTVEQAPTEEVARRSRRGGCTSAASGAAPAGALLAVGAVALARRRTKS